MMINLKRLARRFRRDDEGVTLVEYGIGITLAVVVGTFLLSNLGLAVQEEMKDACTILDNSNPTGGANNTATC
jgi:pilus assembly protein Flp/PilA